MKSLFALFLGALFLGTTYFTGVGKQVADFFTPRIETTVATIPANKPVPPSGTSTNTVDDVVTKALYFKSLLTTAQQNTLQQPYTASLARKWSNLPCGSGCRNGVQLGTLNAEQLGAALEVMKAATGTASNEGYDEFYQIRLADYVLGHQYNANGYDSTIYFLAFLNMPTTTGQWMLQFGGHHYASNIGFNGGKVVGPTPQFRGVEPTSFTVNSTAYAPLNQELTALRAMLSGLTSGQLTTAKLSQTYSDVLLSPGESNGNSNTFPATRVGQPVSALTAAQQALVTAAVEPYIEDIEDASAAILRSEYARGLSGTYIAYTGNGTSGTPTSFLTANTNYVRIDGPRLWLEFICQNGVVINNQIHYHTVWRDHTNDYGADLTLTALPVNVTSFGVNVQGNSRAVRWTAADESAISHFEVERSNNLSGGFVSVGQVAARNVTSNTYSFADNDALTDKMLYYRLKIVDKNGNGRYTDVVTVKLTGSPATLSVYPNPAKDKVTVLLAGDAANAVIKIMSSNGAAVYAKTGVSGNQFAVDVSKLAAGTYVVRVEEGGATATANFLKK